MDLLKLINKLNKLKTTPKGVVADLYRLSSKSLSVAIFSALLVTIFLYNELGNGIIVWCISFILVLLYRLYTAYSYKKDPSKVTEEGWYNKFMISALVTAFIASLLGVAFFSYLDIYHQLFIVMTLLGLSAGAVLSLYSDCRLAMMYVTIILMPMIIELFWISDSLTFSIIPTILLLYYIVQIVMIFNAHNQRLKISELEEDQSLFQNIFNQASIAIFSFDKELNLTGTNSYFNIFFGHEAHEIEVINLANLQDERVSDLFSKALKEGAQNYTGPYHTLKGKDIWVDVDIFPFVGERDQTVGGIGIIKDKTNEKNALDQLKYNARHDELTDLFNRRGFEHSMLKLVQDEAHLENYSLLFYLDLNNFKGINDSLGHNVGDDVLITVANRLRYSLHEKAFISRFGGDEFIIAIPYVSSSKEEVLERAKTFTSKIQTILNDPFILDDLHLHIQASIGIIVIEPNYKNITELIRHADITMYQAKKRHDNVSYYDEALDKMQKELFVLQHDLAYAQENDQLDIFFQPVADIQNNTMISAEALIRWEHPSKGLMNPSEFITLAIKAGLIYKITWWILENVCQAIQRWKEEGLWHIQYISINVNAQQLVEQNFANTFLSILQKYEVETKEIIIEITERSLIDNFESTQSVINQLRQSGVRCAIDDFGVGYSSLSYLQKFSFHTLKIDKEFIKEIQYRPQALNLLQSILHIGREFNYNIIVEGVEHEKQKSLLLEMDKNLYYQGYLFAKPVNEREFEENFLKRD
jgi:diguanylate cyclase (GGDEF)-like protein/PAS domain S-box-containing protein